MSEFKYDVFISHSKKDKAAARDLAKQLKKDGLKVTWEEENLQSSRALILVMSKAAFAADWVKLERQTLLFRDSTHSRRRFIPLLSQDCEIPDVINKFPYIDCRQWSNKMYQKILEECKYNKKINAELPIAKKTVVRESLVLKGHLYPVWDVSLIPDINRVVSCSDDKTIKVWDLDTGKCLATIKGHTKGIGGIAATFDGSRVLSASDDGTLKLWNHGTGNCNATLKGHNGEVNSVIITPDDKRAISGSVDETLKLWNLENGKEVVTLNEKNQIVGKYQNESQGCIGEMYSLKDNKYE